MPSTKKNEKAASASPQSPGKGSTTAGAVKSARPVAPAVAKTKSAVAEKPAAPAKTAAKASKAGDTTTEKAPAKADVKQVAKTAAKPAAKTEPKQVEKAVKPAVSAKPAGVAKPKSAEPAKAAPAMVNETPPVGDVKEAAKKTEAPAPAKPAEKAPTEAARPAAASPAAKPKAGGQKHGFKLNEFIVYPAHGVGQIIGVELQEVAGFSLELFVVSFIKDKMTLKVPTSKVASVGMRKLAETGVVDKALNTLSGRARIKRTMWSRRAQEYEAKINSGDLVTISEVVRDLYRSDTQPEQSYSERQLYEAALDRMAREIAAVRRLIDSEALKLIESFLQKGPRRGQKTDAEADADSDADVEEGDDADVDRAA